MCGSSKPQTREKKLLVCPCQVHSYLEDVRDAPRRALPLLGHLTLRTVEELKEDKVAKLLHPLLTGTSNRALRFCRGYASSHVQKSSVSFRVDAGQAGSFPLGPARHQTILKKLPEGETLVESAVESHIRAIRRAAPKFK